MDEERGPAAYRIHVWIRHINPMISRRLIARSESTLADLHYFIQMAFAWTDYHLHRFRIRGKEYGIPRLGGPWYSRDARDVRLIDFRFRVNERFLYEYDFTDGWEHQVRIEQFIRRSRSQPIRCALAAAGRYRQRTAADQRHFRSAAMQPRGKRENC